jgi:single-stranded DNA-binding protein
MFVTVRTFDLRTVERAARFVAGAVIYVEGRLSVTKRTAADGRQKVEVDVKAWHVRIAEIGRRRAKRDLVHALDPGEVAS